MLFLLGHAYLWSIGVEHGDPSLWNMLYDPVTNCGVFSDYDLAILRGQARLFGDQRTGTVAFMAVELLSNEYFEGQLQRQYGHELEAFIWVFAFASLHYREGRAKKNSPVSGWSTSNYIACRRHKADFWRSQELIKLRSTAETDCADQLELIVQLVRWAYKLDGARGDAAIYSDAGPLPGSDMRSTLASFLTTLKSSKIQLAPLEEVVAKLEEISQAGE